GVLLFLIITGVYLWWPLKRITIKRGSSWRRFHFDLHNTAGIYSAAFLLILGITGLIIHFDDVISERIHKASGTEAVSKNVPSVVQPGVRPIPTDQAVEAAFAALPGID